jgi:ATP-dependent DNA helicase RecQ
MEERRQLILGKMNAMIGYVTNTHRCRMQVIQDYFDEVTFKVCGLCDVCVQNRKKENIHAFEDLHGEVLTVLKKKPLTVEEVEEIIAPRDHDLFVDVIRDMVDEGELEYDTGWRLTLGGGRGVNING